MIAAEGRKPVYHLALALQDPTHKSLTYASGATAPSLPSVKDGDASRVILGAGGAEQLPPRQFLTVMDQLFYAVSLCPSDDEIRSSGRPAGCALPCPIVAGGGCCTGNDLAATAA